MDQVFAKKESCCGCSACQVICPVAAITMHPDSEGFAYPVINKDLCVDCGSCLQVCQYNTLPSSPIEIFAAKHRDDFVRLHSSSGGMFTAISDLILYEGGVVYGAVFDENLHVRHARAETPHERNRMRGSKYTQSDMGTVFTMVCDDLNAGLPVLVSGTPCQIDRLIRYLCIKDIPINKLYTCDFICLGTPSPRLWLDYLRYAEKKYKSTIEAVNFRSKTWFPWQNTGLAHTLSEQVIYSPSSNNLYFSLFSSHLFLRPCCYSCGYIGNHQSDITMADYWGIENIMPDFNDDVGISILYVNTVKGQEILKNVSSSLVLRTSTEEDSLSYNHNAPAVRPSLRCKAWEDYKSKGFSYIAKRYGNQSFINKIAKRCIKRVLNSFGKNYLLQSDILVWRQKDVQSQIVLITNQQNKSKIMRKMKVLRKHRKTLVNYELYIYTNYINNKRLAA